jgi:hypothetical protein
MRTRTTTDVTSIRDTVVGEHAKNPHPELAQEHLRAHLLIHEIVEKQLAEGDPPEVAREALAMMKQGRPLDQEAYVRELQNLTVENYRRSVSSIGMGE